MKFKSLATVAALGIICVFGWMMAFFSSTDAVTNRFIVGNIDIELVESKFKQSSQIRPFSYAVVNTSTNPNVIVKENVNTDTMLVNKNPQIKNIGKNKAYVFLKVEVPRETIRTYHIDKADKKNVISAPALTELYTFMYQSNATDGYDVDSVTNGKIFLDEDMKNTWNDSADENGGYWIELSFSENAKKSEYIFAYVTSNSEMAVLEPNASTSELFNVVRFCNYYPWQKAEYDALTTYTAELAKLSTAKEIADYKAKNPDPNEIYGTDLSKGIASYINISAYAVQSDEIPEKSPTEVWNTYWDSNNNPSDD